MKCKKCWNNFPVLQQLCINASKMSYLLIKYVLFIFRNAETNEIPRVTVAVAMYSNFHNNL